MKETSSPCDSAGMDWKDEYKRTIVKASICISRHQNRGRLHLREEPIRYPAYRVGGVRRKDGVSPIWARLWNCGNPNSDAKGEGQVKKSKVQSTDALFGGGSICSSNEAPVMGVERRGRVVPVDAHVNFFWGG